MADPKRKPRNLFLDTQVFDRHGMDLEHPNFKTLAAHVANGDVRMFSTTVTVGEIGNHFMRRAEEAHEALRSIKNKHPIVLCVKKPPVSDVFDKNKLKKIGDEMRDELLAQLKAWLTKNKVTVLAVKDVDPEQVFKMYFEERPPFGSGDKKSEFPDAFALHALWQWCVHNKEEMYVVSEDKKCGDFCGTFKDLKYIERLSKFLEKLLMRLQMFLSRQNRTRWKSRKSWLLSPAILRMC